MDRPTAEASIRTLAAGAKFTCWNCNKESWITFQYRGDPTVEEAVRYLAGQVFIPCPHCQHRLTSAHLNGVQVVNAETATVPL